MESKEKEPVHIGELSHFEVEELKKKHKGPIYEIEVRMEDETWHGYLRRPKRSEIGQYLNMERNNVITAKEWLIDQVWVGGAELIRTDDTGFLSACTVVREIIEVNHAELKKK